MKQAKVKHYCSFFAQNQPEKRCSSNISSSPVPVNLSKLSDVVKNDVVKKAVYDKLVAKVNSIDTSRFVLKTKYDLDKSELEIKIPDTSGLVKKATDYSTKTTEIQGEIPSISGLATNSALTAVENKIPNINSLVEKKNRL